MPVLARKNQTIAPEYRYFTVDMLTGDILAEIPLRGVSYACALKSAGKFQGKIPVTAETASMDLHNSTLPGNTAIYVVRNGKCVWGGIIWARDYDESMDLVVSASEFTSYFFHRKIWKTWNHKFGATVSYSASQGWRVLFDIDSNVLAKPGSTVKLDFYEPENFKYNGYYRVGSTPAPSVKGFPMVGGSAVADIVSTEIRGGWYGFYTKENHGYTTGDVVSIVLTSFDGTPLATPTTVVGIVDSPGGAATNYFQITWSPVFQPLTVVEGVASRPLPQGTYEDVTVTVRQDAYDYIRTLIDAMFDDFVTTDFPNVYIEPGISWSLPVVLKESAGGYAILETGEDHGIAPGQAIQIKDVGSTFDGEYEVTDTPATNVLVYESGGNVPLTAVTPMPATITTVFMSAGVATAVTSSAHGYVVGQRVTVDVGDPYGDFSGTFVVTGVPSTTQFRYDTGTGRNYSSTTLNYATATVAGDPTNEVSRVQVAGNVVTLELKNPVVNSVGDSVTIQNVNRDLQIVEKAFDAPNSKATLKTAEDHGLSVGDVVTVLGTVDVQKVISKRTTTTSVTMTTARPHNFRAGDSISIQGIDAHRVINKALTSNVATITTEANHNVSVGASVTVSDLQDTVAIAAREATNNVAKLTTSGPHNFQVNDSIVVSGLDDRYTVISKEAVNGTATLTTLRPHNVLIGSKIQVHGVGLPFDGTEIVVDEVTATRIVYKVDERNWKDKQAAAARAGQNLQIPLNVPATKTAGFVIDVNSFYNGEYTVTARTNTTLSYARRGEDQPPRDPTGTNYVVSGPSVFNGTYTVSGRTNNTLSYARVGNNVTSVGVAIPATEEDPQPAISLASVNTGSRIVTSVTANTFTFNQTMPSSTLHNADLEARKASIFNGTRTITEVPTTDRFSFTINNGYPGSIFEESPTMPAFIRASVYDGVFTITNVDAVRNTISYTKALKNFPSKSVLSNGHASVNPVVVISSFGPFPGNADIDMQFSSQGYTGINLEPAAYRGFELKSVGDALDAYSDNINGFEYRVDCDFDAENNRFTKKFVLIPINFPDPPAPGTVAPLSRYGADKLIFEYPGGNITSFRISESAENSATRFFASGETDLGPEAGPNIGIASAEDLLTGKTGRRWPLLDASETISGVSDENELHAYAKRYLSEAAPPYTTLAVSLNGSIAPYVGTYRPGDWCALILDDPFMNMRLASNLEPRSDVFVRKISSYEVSVPDGVTFPETVTLNLVAEWEVDTRGQ